MQDGIVKRLLDDTCPQSGYQLCAYQKPAQDPRQCLAVGRPTACFAPKAAFTAITREESRIIADSLARYPLLQVKSGADDSVLQFFTFKTGDGIESQEWILKPEFEQMMPGQLPAYLAARQQTRTDPFRGLQHDPCHGRDAVAAGAGRCCCIAR